MTDISILWDVASGRGDWGFSPFSIAGQQISVATPVAFGYGDGAATQFALAPTAGPISAVVSAQIYRNDWHGNQLLYPTPRTNRIRQSANMTVAPWQTSNGTAFIGTVTQSTDIAAPDGTATAVNKLVVVNNSNLGARSTHTAPAGQRTGSIWAYVPSGQSGVVGLWFNNDYGDTESGSIVTTSVFDAWVQLTSTANVASARTWQDFNLKNGNNTNLPVGTIVYLAFAEDEDGAGGAYIPVTTADVTVTDYTLSSTGLVTLASAAATGAVLSWSGAYVSNVASGGFLQTGNDLQTAVLLSLFTDRVANSDDFIPDGTGDPRGWWGDVGEDTPIGSRLWLLDRSKQTQEVLNNARDYITEALQWLVDDGVVASMDVQTEWTRDTFLGAQIMLYQPAGPGVALTFAWAWQQIS
ncbi:phage GP46 family protein [Caballeronia sp. LZ035]|uniref:phage GP46 family protein n=1 Tax=Caballeronia sp. LZ035 TaxID=3038568 RepID=UPI00286463F4|nr:phage GP46 family protein [Caballeronia sp. LZ035]MDR5757031.1 phage GP46 family protein [Caballeronia sp. LZ035]